MVLLRLRSAGLTILQSPADQHRAEGLYFGKGGFEGWDDGSVMLSESLSRPQSHGDFDMPGFLAGRLMAIEGWCIADSQYELEQYRDQFIGHGSDGGKFVVAVERNGRTLRAEARVASGQKPTFVDTGGVNRAKWSTMWWFPDPRKYGDANTFGPASSVEVIQRGNFPALPVLHITGASAGGYTITGPQGRQIVVTRPLVAGVPHRFDMRTARLYVGGSRVLGGIARADLFTVPPGLPVTPISISAGLLRVEVDDTFN